MSSNSSMYPTIGQGDLFIVSTKINPNDLETGDIVLIKGALLNKNYPLTKRIIGVHGDVIEIKNDTVYLNKKLLSEPYAYYKRPLILTTNGVWEVKKSHFFVMGDNRNNSIDSRHSNFGLLKHNSLIGKVIFKF